MIELKLLEDKYYEIKQILEKFKDLSKIVRFLESKDFDKLETLIPELNKKIEENTFIQNFGFKFKDLDVGDESLILNYSSENENPENYSEDDVEQLSAEKLALKMDIKEFFRQNGFSVITNFIHNTEINAFTITITVE